MLPESPCIWRVIGSRGSALSSRFLWLLSSGTDCMAGSRARPGWVTGSRAWRVHSCPYSSPLYNILCSVGWAAFLHHVLPHTMSFCLGLTDHELNSSGTVSLVNLCFFKLWVLGILSQDGKMINTNTYIKASRIISSLFLVQFLIYLKTTEGVTLSFQFLHFVGFFFHLSWLSWLWYTLEFRINF